MTTAIKGLTAKRSGVQPSDNVRQAAWGLLGEVFRARPLTVLEFVVVEDFADKVTDRRKQT